MLQMNDANDLIKEITEHIKQIDSMSHFHVDSREDFDKTRGSQFLPMKDKDFSNISFPDEEKNSHIRNIKFKKCKFEYVTLSQASFKIAKQSLERLQSEGVPKKVLENLKSIQDQRFTENTYMPRLRNQTISFTGLPANLDGLMLHQN